MMRAFARIALHFRARAQGCTRLESASIFSQPRPV